MTMKWTVLLSCLLATAVHSQVGDVLGNIADGMKKVISDIKNPVDKVIVGVGSSQCDTVKDLLGVAYEQLEGKKEPDVNQLTLLFKSRAVNVTYNITAAAKAIPLTPGFNPHQDLVLFIHGFIDDPSRTSFNLINDAFFSQGEYNVVALDGSPLIRWLYLRSSTYVRFMGERLGEVLAAMVENGVKPSAIHIIGHSLGSHIASFAGKTFTAITGQLVGRISALDPAGPCFSHIDQELRLQRTDAEFVDVMHTDAGVFGLKDYLGHVDYYPNGGSQQAGCVLSTCSHNRAWAYYAESVANAQAFVAIKCQGLEEFMYGNCTNEISYMGYPAKDRQVRGQFYLQTAGNSPFGLGEEGIRYTKEEGLVKSLLN